jgi:phosphoglycolate phosphatase
MLQAAMTETGSRPCETMLVGDTSFDILMAKTAGAMPVGVRWGNHAPEELLAAGAAAILDHFAELIALVEGSADMRTDAAAYS